MVNDIVLKRIGMSWFVSYCFYEHIDKTHLNWNKVPTVNMRKNYYLSSRESHKKWLQDIFFYANDSYISKNTIELSAKEVKTLAYKLLLKFGEI